MLLVRTGYVSVRHNEDDNEDETFVVVVVVVERHTLYVMVDAIGVMSGNHSHRASVGELLY